MRHHVIISGTGRSGTTFLVQLLTQLGLDMGFRDPFSAIYVHSNAGIEKDIRTDDAPYIIKNPWLCDYLGEVLEGGNVIIDHAIIPIRNLYSAAESRKDIARRADTTLYATPDSVPGGLWHTQRGEDQEHRTDDPAVQPDLCPRSIRYTHNPVSISKTGQSAGMPTVTNTFANKKAEKLRAISSNIVPVSPTVDGIAEEPLLDLRRSEDYEARVAGSNVNWPTSWEDAFGPNFTANLRRFLEG